MIIITGYSDVFDQMVQTDTGVTSMCLCITPKPARDKMRDGADQNDDNLRISICGSVITVGLGLRLGLGLGLELGLGLGFGLGFGLRIGIGIG